MRRLAVIRVHPGVSHVDQMIVAYPCGITVPIRCLLSNGKLAVVKYPCNQVGNQVLINEWVCNKIAQEINVPVPPIGCCLLDQKSSFGPELQSQLINGEIDFGQNNYGIAFYSRLILNTIPLQKKFMTKMTNGQFFINMLLFDQIVCNIDRHHGNVLYSLTDQKFYAIDCSNVFNSQRAWTAQSLLTEIAAGHFSNVELLLSTENGETYDYFWESVNPTASQIVQEAAHIQQVLTPQKICDIINTLPDEWKTYLKDSQRQAVEQYLNFRISHITDTAKLIIQERGIL